MSPARIRPFTTGILTVDEQLPLLGRLIRRQLPLTETPTTPDPEERAPAVSRAAKWTGDFPDSMAFPPP
jgi:hypothetical protein